MGKPHLFKLFEQMKAEDRETVKKLYPEAYESINPFTGLWTIYKSISNETIGEGLTDDAAWANAAKAIQESRAHSWGE